MNPVFEKQYEVGFNEVDFDGMMKSVSIMDWFQNTASSQSHALGIPVTDLISRGITWVVYKYRLKIIKRPRWRDPVKVRTWRRPQLNDFSAPREFEVTAADGSILAIATGIFKLIDIKSKTVLSPEVMIPHYPLFDRILFQEDTMTSFSELADGYDFESSFKIRRSDLDMNRHVNNVNYVSWAMESVPDALWKKNWASEIEVFFKRSAEYPGTIVVKTQKQDNYSLPCFHHTISGVDSVLAFVKTLWSERR